MTYNGTIAVTPSRPVSIQNCGAGTSISFTGSSVGTKTSSTSNGILVQTVVGSLASPSNITFSGASKPLNVGANTAVAFTGAANVTLTFSNGGLAITRTSGAGINASTAGTLVVTRNGGTANTIGSGTNGTALSVNNVTIGSGGLVFESISQSGGSNGIFLQNTGSTAGLTVTGNSSGNCGGKADTNTGDIKNWTTVAPSAADCTGGTIQSTTGADNSTSGTGIYLNNTQKVSLTRMKLNDHQNYAIQITNVTGFTADNLYITGTNGNNGTYDEGGIWISNLAGTTAAGTNASITNSTIEGAYEHNVWMVNNTATLDRITFDNVTVGANAFATGDKGIGVEVSGTSTTRVTVQNCRFTSARGDMFNLTVQGTSGLSDLIINNTEFNNTHGNIVSGGGGVMVNVGESGDLTYNITNNSFRGAKGVGLGVQKLFGGLPGNGTASGTIDNNQLGVSGVLGSASSEASGMIITILGRGSHTSKITNNVIRGYQNYGIYLFVGGSGTSTTGLPAHDGTYHVTVSNNTIAEPTNTWTFPQYGVFLRGGTNGATVSPPAPADAYQMCVDILNNQLASSGSTSPPPPAEDMFVWQRFNTTLRLPGYGGAATDDAAVAAYLVGRNSNGGPQALAAHNTGFTGGAACNQP